MFYYRLLTLTLLFAFISSAANAQTDTLTFNNNEIVVGEVKSLSRGVLTVETDYSDSDFKIEWEKVAKFRSNQDYLVTLTDGRRFASKVNSVAGDSVLMSDGIFAFTVNLPDIVVLKPLDESFWDRFSASIDVGLNLTRANNFLQFNSSSNVGYYTEKWEINGNYNTVFSRQDSIQDTRRMDANVQLRVFFSKNWFINISNDFLQNDEQKLSLRSATRAGIGNYVVNTNSLYLALFVGASFNHESYIENANPDRQTGEGYGGLEYNMFNTGDISLLTSAIAYPNLTDLGRLRVDF